MKKNIFSDSESTKGSKGFYAALGISALMIGSACYFAYDQSEKISENNPITAESSTAAQDEAVDKKSTDIPKVTASTTAYIGTAAYTTTSVITETSAVTLPAAEIVADTPPTEAAEDTTAAEASGRLDNPKPPLADMSNIINPFSGSELVKNETTGSWQTHNGIDIAAEVGTEVCAVSAGQITAVNEDPLWGITVIIDHYNGFVTKYCSLAKDLNVQKGDTVVSGDVIGVLGDTADIESSLPPHLHFEILHNGTYEDPLSFINQ